MGLDDGVWQWQSGEVSPTENTGMIYYVDDGSDVRYDTMDKAVLAAKKYCERINRPVAIAKRVAIVRPGPVEVVYG